MAGGAPFEQIIQHMLSANNEARQAAEAAFEEAKQQPDVLVGNLVQSLRSCHEQEIRALCAVMLRRVLTKEDPGLWPKLSPNLQGIVKQQLLEGIRAEKAQSIKKKICDTTSELAAVTSDTNSWPELLPFIFQLVQSQDLGERESALLIFAQLAHYIMPTLTQYMGTLNSILQQCLSSSNADVALAAMRATTAFIQELEDNQDRDKFKPMIPAMLGTIATVLNEGEEVAAQEALELFIEVAEAHPRFLRHQLGEVLTAMLQIAEADALDESTRQLATEFLVTLCEAREKAPGMMRKLPQIIGRLFQCLMGFLLDIEDVPEWHQGDSDKHEAAGGGELYEFGQECLDRLALSLGGNTVAPMASTLLVQLMASPDWKQRHAALIALAQIAEGCAKLMQKSMSGLVDMCLRGLQDTHPKVRWAACQALGQMCTDLCPELQEEEHARILPALLAVMDDFDNPRVQAHSSAAIVNFTEGGSQELMPPYLDTLIMKLTGLLRNGQRIVQEGALTAMASVADCAKGHFVNYYSQVIPLLREILTRANDKTLNMMRAKALECISLVGMSIGKERFREDAHQVLQYMQTLQAQGLDPDDPTHSYMLQAGARLCKCLGEEFVPYLSVVMPPLLHTAELKPDITVQGGSDSEAESDDEEDEHETIYVGDQRVSIRTSLLEEKATAVNMLCCYADELKEGFYPYVAQVSSIIVPLLKFYFHEEVRTGAAQMLCELLRSASLAAEKGQNGATQANVKQLLDYIWPALMDAISKEPDQSVLSSMLEAVSDIVDVVKPALLSLDQLGQAFQRFKVVLDASKQRRQERLQRRNEEDFDEDEAEAIEEENSEEEDLLDELSGALTTILKEYGDAAMPLIDSIMPQIGQLLDPSRSPAERRIGICIIDDLLEHSAAGSAKYMVQVLPVLLDASKNRDPNLRQCAVYGLGVLAEHRPEGFRQIAATAIQTILAVVNDPNARSEDNLSATENALSSLGKILEFQPDVADAQQGKSLAQTWVQALPITEDTVEAVKVHAQLVRFLEKSDPRILGDSNSNLPKVAQVIGFVLSKGSALADSETTSKMKILLGQMQQSLPESVMQEVMAQVQSGGRSFQGLLNGQAQAQ